jgi:hypothetical protein
LTYAAGTWMWTKKDVSTLYTIKMKSLHSSKKEDRIKSKRMLERYEYRNTTTNTGQIKDTAVCIIHE